MYVCFYLQLGGSRSNFFSRSMYAAFCRCCDATISPVRPSIAAMSSSFDQRLYLHGWRLAMTLALRYSRWWLSCNGPSWRVGESSRCGYVELGKEVEGWKWGLRNLNSSWHVTLGAADIHLTLLRGHFCAHEIGEKLEQMLLLSIFLNQSRETHDKTL